MGASHDAPGTRMNGREPRVDVVILSALPVEHRAVVQALVESGRDVRQRGDECLAVVGSCRVAAASLSAMGNAGAAAGAQWAIDRWHPACLVLVGIAAGVGAAAGQRFGDVIVADSVVGYEPGKHDGHGLRRRPDVHRPAFSMLAAARTVAAAEWLPDVRVPRPRGRPAPAGPHFGTVLTGEKVLADARVFDRLRREWPATVGVEMEALGVATAAHRNETGFFLIKGISDFADEGKDDAWREYAAHAAARFAIAVLRRRHTPADLGTDDDPDEPAWAAPRAFTLVPPGTSACRIVAVAGSLHRTRGADLWVNSENTDMEMSRITEFTISGIIRYWGAARDDAGRVTDDLIADELAARVRGRTPVAPGTAIVTGSGALAASHGGRHVIHVASVVGEPGAGFRQVRNLALCVSNALAEAERLAPALELRTVLFPLLGAGAGGGQLEHTVTTMIEAVIEFLAARPCTALSEVRLLGFTNAEWRVLTDALAGRTQLLPVPAP